MAKATGRPRSRMAPAARQADGPGVALRPFQQRDDRIGFLNIAQVAMILRTVDGGSEVVWVGSVRGTASTVFAQSPEELMCGDVSAPGVRQGGASGPASVEE